MKYKQLLWGNVLKVFFVAILVLVYVGFGSLVTILLKIQGETFVKTNEKPPSQFDHPFLQVLLTKIGFSLGIFVHIIVLMLKRIFKLEKREEEDQEEDFNDLTKVDEIRKGKLNTLYYLIPSLLNMIGNFLVFTGLSLTFASIYQMYISSITVFTSIFVVFFFKKKFSIFQWTGVVIVVIGAVCAGVSSIVFHKSGIKEEKTLTQMIVGNICCISGQIFIALQFICEEYAYRLRPETTPFEVVGYSGLWGIGSTSIVLLLSTFFTPSFDDSRKLILELISSFPFLLSFILGLFVSVLTYNIAGNVITKTTNCASRGIIDCCRMIVVWVVQIIRGRDFFEFLRFGGMCLIFLGNFIYFEVVPVVKICTLLRKKLGLRSPKEGKCEENTPLIK